MKFNRVLALSAVSLAFAAQAAPTAPGGNIGTLTLFPALYYNIFAVPQAGSFNDPYAFTLSIASTVYGSIYTVSGTPDVSAVFVDSTPSFLGGGSGIWGFTTGPLAAGTYTLSVLGTGPALSGAAYIGSIYAVPSAVPEPESLALALGGLGILGAWGMRKRSV
jgi:PEP-CTERM motif